MAWIFEASEASPEGNFFKSARISPVLGDRRGAHTPASV
jgi:hypothetical protein